MTRPNWLTIKCGGSLLALPDLADRLLHVVDASGLSAPIVIVGGGSAADLVRAWDQRFGLSSRDAHLLAIQAMSLNARLLTALHRRFRLITSLDEMSQDNDGCVAVLDVAAALPLLEQDRVPLQDSWDVTSDSIAAWFSAAVGTSLLLLKSVDLPLLTGGNERPLDVLADQSLVDACFPDLAVDIPELWWCNLSRLPPVIQTIPTH